MVPKFNNIPSRTIPDLSTRLTTGTDMKVPIVAANMDTVIGPALSEVMNNYGSIPILHRFYKDDEIGELIRTVTRFRRNCFLSWGVNDPDKFKHFVDDNGLEIGGVCLDIAHGHSQSMFETIGDLLKWDPHLEIIAGNICTSQAFHDLVNAGASAIKVGIGPGSVCTTRAVTAFGVAQFTAIQDCAKIARELKVPMIADGGIRGSREVILALAAGASSVMIGGLFGATNEARGNGVFRGQASSEFQKDFYGKVKKGTVPEGEAVIFHPDERFPASAVMEELLGGLRSGMTYGGAKTIGELQAKAEFMTITANY